MKFWQVADASPERWLMQRSLTEPDSMAIAELIQQICSITLNKAQDIVDRICPTSNWATLKSFSPNELQSAGLTQKQTARLLAALEFGKRAMTLQPRTDKISDPESAAAFLQYDLGFASVEKAALLILDIKHNLIAKEIIAIGSCQECIVDPKVVFERILRNQGCRFILAHNHPSSTPDPSPEDIELTENFLKAAQFMSIRMLDHLVIVTGSYCSMRETLPCLWLGHEE
ncbi:MAG: DNA repair protein RadC [Thermosynechococcaceae cyanobacterium]